MAVSIRIFRAEHGADLEHSIHVSAENHLLVKLGTLCEAGFLFEIFKTEDVCTAL